LQSHKSRALLTACHEENEDVVAHLLENKADPKTLKDHTDNRFFPVTGNLLRNGHIGIIRRLLKASGKEYDNTAITQLRKEWMIDEWDYDPEPVSDAKNDDYENLDAFFKSTTLSESSNSAEESPSVTHPSVFSTPK